MSVHQDRQPIPIDKIRPLRPALFPVDQPQEGSQREIVPLSTVDFILETLARKLSPESINKMYVTKRPAAIEERNKLLKVVESLD